jgi:hypothetical protein
VILRRPVVQRWYRGSDEAPERCVADRPVRRQFCGVDLAPVPDDTPLLRGANLIAPAPLAAVNERVVGWARSWRVPRGRRRRVGRPVVAPNSHHPTDRGLLGEGVLSRLVRRAQAVRGPPARLGPQAFRGRRRSVRRQRRQWPRLARQKGGGATAELQQAYQRPIAVARKSAAQAGRVCAALHAAAHPAGAAGGAAVRAVPAAGGARPRPDRAAHRARGSGAGPGHAREPC